MQKEQIKFAKRNIPWKTNWSGTKEKLAGPEKKGRRKKHIREKNDKKNYRRNQQLVENIQLRRKLERSPAKKRLSERCYA